MYETDGEIAALQDLLDRSRAGATDHLKEIVAGDRALTARDLVERLTGMKVLSLATVTARGEPRISAVDGHFLHGSWSFGTDGRAAKARHLEARPAISVAHVDGEALGVFSHGRASRLLPDDEDAAEVVDHWTRHYGASPFEWGDDVRLYRFHPTWMVGYAGG